VIYFIKHYKLVNKRLCTALVPAKRLSARVK